MRILIVTEHFWPESFRINDVALGLHARGHVVGVLTGMPNYPTGRYFPGYKPWGPLSQDRCGIKVDRVPVLPRGGGGGWRMLLNYASYVVLASVRLVLERKDWDAVLVFQPSPVTTVLPALVLRFFRGTPVVTWVQDLWPESIAASGLVRSSWLIRVAGIFCRWIYRSCDQLLAQSEAFVPRLSAAGVDPDRLTYLPNWAEELYSKESVPRSPVSEVWAQGFPVMFAGNLGRVQALDTVLDAAERLRYDPAIRWVFLGDGVLLPWLKMEIERRGLADRIHLLGRRPTDEMPSFFARAGAMLVSLKRDDILSLTIPSKIQSYLAAGVPILGSLDGEGARIIEESQAGWAAPAGDPEALARTVQRMSALGVEERTRMGRQGRAYYQRHFSRRLCLDRLEQMLTAFEVRREAAAA